MKITPEISSILKSYVYVYSDPRNGQPFYIGKGKGNRIFSHLNDLEESEKTAIIKEIKNSGKEPIIDILRYGLTNSAATLVEASAIDLIGLHNLSNRISGHHSRSFGRIGSADVISMLRAKPIIVQHKAILITINRLYRSDMSPDELYEATRGVWRVSKTRANKAEIVLSIFQGIIREVYRVKKWYPAGTLKYNFRDDPYEEKHKNRWEFEGNVAQDLRKQYLGKSVGVGGQNPIRYKNI